MHESSGHLSWGEFLALAHGGRFSAFQRTLPNGTIEHGPLKQVRQKNKKIVFETTFTQRKEPCWPTFVTEKSSEFVFDETRAMSLSLNQDGTVWVSVPHLGEIELIQKHPRHVVFALHKERLAA